LLRAEMSALTGLLERRGVIDRGEWLIRLEREAEKLSADYERRFPRVTATETGLTLDKRSLPWMKGGTVTGANDGNGWCGGHG